jgi:hypothetical protein
VLAELTHLPARIMIASPWRIGSAGSRGDTRCSRSSGRTRGPGGPLRPRTRTLATTPALRRLETNSRDATRRSAHSATVSVYPSSAASTGDSTNCVTIGQ